MLAHDRLDNRYELRGLLLLDTALHVGTGQSSAATDAAVVQDYLGRPLIPGSSLKGALRSAVERRAGWLGLRSCSLEKNYPGCLTTSGVPDDPNPVPDSKSPAEKGKRWRDQPLHWRLKEMARDDGGLCHVCRTFGSTVFGGQVQIDDLPLAPEFDPLAMELLEVRDGVGIDRDSGTAVDGVKFDYQVVPSIAAFRCCITAENLDTPGLALLSLGLLEMMNGAVPLGGNTSRGLGRCRLQVDSLHRFEFAGGNGAAQRIIQYLQRQDDYGRVPDPAEFLRCRVKKWLEEKDAQAADQ